MACVLLGQIKGMLFQRGEAEKEIAALRKENDSYAERFRSLEDALRVALKDAALWQSKVTQAEDKSAQALRDKVAAGAAAAAAKNDLKQANARLERVELEVRRGNDEEEEEGLARARGARLATCRARRITWNTVRPPPPPDSALTARPECPIVRSPPGPNVLLCAHRPAQMSYSCS